MASENEGRAPITAYPFPPNDLVFAMRVQEGLRDLQGLPVAQAMDRLCRRLRPVHHEVEARLRSDIAGFGDAPVVYVFRDGLARRSFSDDWVGDMTAARLVTDASGIYVDANAQAAGLFGVERDDIIGHQAGSFTRLDARIQDAAALWAVLEAQGRLHSLAIIRRPDGTEHTVEFVTVRDGDGPGRHVTLLRVL